MEILSRVKMNLTGLKMPAVLPDSKAVFSDMAIKEESELRKAIAFTLTEWKCAEQNFETAETSEMVEHFTYKIKACEVKYQFLLRQLKRVTKEDINIS